TPREAAMSPLKRSNNIAARMGRWSARHWKTAVFGWLAFVVAALYIGQAVGTKTIKSDDSNVGQAHRADQVLKKAFPQTNPRTELVVIQNQDLTLTAPAVRQTVNEVVDAVKGRSTVKNVNSPYAPGNADQVSHDGHTVTVTWDMKGNADTAKK